MRRKIIIFEFHALHYEIVNILPAKLLHFFVTGLYLYQRKWNDDDWHVISHYIIISTHETKGGKYINCKLSYVP